MVEHLSHPVAQAAGAPRRAIRPAWLRWLARSWPAPVAGRSIDDQAIGAGRDLLSRAGSIGALAESRRFYWNS